MHRCDRAGRLSHFRDGFLTARLPAGSSLGPRASSVGADVHIRPITAGLWTRRPGSERSKVSNSRAWPESICNCKRQRPAPRRQDVRRRAADVRRLSRKSLVHRATANSGRRRRPSPTSKGGRPDAAGRHGAAFTSARVESSDQRRKSWDQHRRAELRKRVGSHHHLLPTARFRRRAASTSPARRAAPDGSRRADARERRRRAGR